MFKIPFEILDDSICSIAKTSSLAMLLKMTQLLIGMNVLCRIALLSKQLIVC
jgi:hypothetical protein